VPEDYDSCSCLITAGSHDFDILCMW